MLEEIQDDTLAFLQSEIDKNQTGEPPVQNTNESGGLYYGPGSSKPYRDNTYKNSNFHNNR